VDVLTPPTVVTFRQRWRRVMLATVLFILPLSLLEAEVSPLADLSFGQHFLLVGGLLAVWCLVFFTSWRCPDCGRLPSQHWRPLYCGHCGAPLLQSGSGPAVRLETWRTTEDQWYRDQHKMWAGQYCLALIVVVITVFVFGIVYGIGGEAGDGSASGRKAGLVFAALLALMGPLLIRGMHRQLEAAGVPPDRVERGVAGFVAIAAVVMILCGFGGLLYAIPGLALDSLAGVSPLAIGCAAYTLAGVLLLGWSLLRWRSSGCVDI
jgi:hypothetical protein